MAEIHTKCSTDLGLLLGGANVEVHEESLFDTLVLLGENPTDTENPPMHIRLQPYCGPYVDGYARLEPEYRDVHVAMGYLPVLYDVFCRYKPEYLRLKTEAEINRTLLHELSHGVAYLNADLHRRHMDHYKRLTHRPDGSQRAKASVYIRHMMLTDRYTRIAPLEVLADEQVAAISASRGVPRIIRISE